MIRDDVERDVRLSAQLPLIRLGKIRMQPVLADGTGKAVTYVPPTRDAHRGETRLRSYKYDYELHIPEA
jgi:hypothetical protein